MIRKILLVAFVLSSKQMIASKIITLKTVINEKILPAFFPVDKAVAWSKIYFDSARSLLAFHCNASTMELDPEDLDFAIVRNTTNRGRIAKWINHKWIATASEHEYNLRSSEKKK